MQAAPHARRLFPALLRTATTTTSMATTTRPANGGAPSAAAPAAPAAAAPADAPAARRTNAETAPLSAVVKDAVRRWYEDALREAERGDIVSGRRGGGGVAREGDRTRALARTRARPHRSSHLSSPSHPPQKQQALLSQMLIEGYGCTPDPAAAERWAARARRKGYRMEGVYCTI